MTIRHVWSAHQNAGFQHLCSIYASSSYCVRPEMSVVEIRMSLQALPLPEAHITVFEMLHASPSKYKQVHSICACSLVLLEEALMQRTAVNAMPCLAPCFALMMLHNSTSQYINVA